MLKSKAHTHIDTNDVVFTKCAFGYEARIRQAMASIGGTSSATYIGMFKIEDTSDYVAGTLQVGIYDSFPPTATNAGWAKINIADPFVVPLNLALAVPPAFITEVGDPIDYGFICVRFEDAESPVVASPAFSIMDGPTFETYVADECHHLLGRVYGTKVTDGSLTTYNPLVIQQDHTGWVNDVIYKECP